MTAQREHTTGEQVVLYKSYLIWKPSKWRHTGPNKFNP